MKFLIVALALLLSSITPAFATNTYFMPGDSFFATTLNRDLVKSFAESDGQVTIRYHRPPQAQASFCGFAGFNQLVLEDVPQGLVKSLEVVFENLGSPKNLKNNDGPFLFVYNRDFQIRPNHIGLKFNEEWDSPPNIPQEDDAEKKNPLSKGYKIPAVAYESFLINQKAIRFDKKDGKLFRRLDVTIPEEVNWWYVGQQIEEPVTGRFPDLKFVIVPKDRLEKVYLEQNGADIFIVDGETVQRFVYQNGWREFKIAAP